VPQPELSGRCSGSAAAVSLTTVIATSSAVSFRRDGTQIMNLRFGMVLEVATVALVTLGRVGR
jgi:hypothetical protein